MEVDTPSAVSSPPDLLPSDLLKRIAAHGVTRSYARNTVLINEGDTTDSFYIIVTGKVKVYLSNSVGREVIVDFHGPGEYVGEMAFTGLPRSASVLTVEPSTCVVVSRSEIRDFLAAHPDFALHLIGRLIDRARRATENIKQLALSDTYGRLVKLLDQLAKPEGKEWVVAEKLSQQDLANRIGASRDMVSRLLRDLAAGGYISIHHRSITIHRKLPLSW
ncbi:MAG: Crp/Fnr family transcriptional regulator [Betaproteobacteria bacterium]|nr:Crp/Fnr family transcriptional regulator [Betaproteobacteria bacterium]